MSTQSSRTNLCRIASAHQQFVGLHVAAAFCALMRGKIAIRASEGPRPIPCPQAWTFDQLPVEKSPNGWPSFAPF